MPRSGTLVFRGWLQRHRIDVVLVGLACLFVFLGAAWVSASVFERLPHTEDEAAFLFQAQTVASGRIVADAPEYPDPFAIPFIIVRDGMWFGKYPPGYPALLATGVLVGHPWLVNATLAACCVLLVYVLARRMYGVSTARLAAPLLAVSPFLLLQAGSLLSHVASLFWTLLFILLFQMARNQMGAWLPLGAGIAVGMLFITRPLTAVGVALPFVLWALYDIARRRRIHVSYLWMAAAALPFLAVFLSYNNMTTGSPFKTAYELWWSFDRIGFGPDRGLDGHDLDDAWRNTKINTTALASYLFGWPGRMSLVPAVAIALVSALTLAVSAVTARRGHSSTAGQTALCNASHDLLLAGVVLGVIGIHLLYWTPGQMYGPRYFMETIGPLAILTARCIDELRLAVASLLDRSGSLARPGFVSSAVAVAALTALTLWGLLVWAPGEYDRFRNWNDISGDDLALVEAYELDNVVVVVERDSWTAYAPFFARNRPSLDTGVVYASRRDATTVPSLVDMYPDREILLFQDGELIPVAPR